MRTLSARLSSSSLALATLASLAFGATLLTSSDAAASGYLTARFGADHGTPATPNTYAVYFNPAALGGTTGTTITGDASVLLRWASYQRSADALSPSNEASKQDLNYRAQNVGRGNLLNLLAIPYLGVNTDFGGSKYFRAGYAFYIPFGGFATWDRRPGNNGVPGSIDGVQRWHNISGQILAIYNTFAFAVKLHPRFSLGLNFSPVVHTVSTVRARNGDGSDDTVNPNGLVEGRSLVTAHGLNFSGALGAYWEPTDNLRFGVSYTSQPGFGETKMSGELRTQISEAPSGSPDKIDFLQSYPDVIRFGAAVRTSQKLELKGDFEFVRWSVLDRQCVVKAGGKCGVADDGGPMRDASGAAIRDAGGNLSNKDVVLNVPRKWNNAIGLRIGPAYQVTEQLELFGSAGFTTPAVPVATIDAATIDAFRLYGTFGARYIVSRHVALAASYNHIYFFTVDTKGRNDQNLQARPAGSTDAQGVSGGEYNASRSPSADGKYSSQIGFVNVNIAYTF